MTDLVVRNARCVATVDARRREIEGGWVAITGGLVEAVGAVEPPDAATVIDAGDCLVTPGLVNTHHHMFQNLTRAFPPMTDKPLFGWLTSLYPLWAALDTESEKIVMEALERLMKGRTVITIAHRLSTIRDAHKIVVLKGGFVAEEGTHAELTALNGIYAELYRIQAGSTPPA